MHRQALQRWSHKNTLNYTILSERNKQQRDNWLEKQTPTKKTKPKPPAKLDFYIHLYLWDVTPGTLSLLKTTFFFTQKEEEGKKNLHMDNERFYLISQLLLQLKHCQRFLLPLFPLLRGQWQQHFQKQNNRWDSVQENKIVTILVPSVQVNFKTLPGIIQSLISYWVLQI